MAYWLELTLDDPDAEHEVNAEQVLGDSSPLVFEDGYASVDDEADAAEMARRYSSIERSTPPEGEDGERPRLQATAEDEDEPPDRDDAQPDEGDDIDQLLDGTVDEVDDALEAGDYDDRLDEIEDRADRQGVVDAVDDRREE